MTTRSSTAHSNEPGIPTGQAAGTGASSYSSSESSYGDPVDDLVRAAVADRPLEDIVHLVTLLEQSPEYAQATAAALRAVGVDRSVEDVTRLVALLTSPPRDADSADEAIRAAAACRPVEDVTRLVDLLHKAPLEPHCGQEAVRAAATGRPVEDLVELIGRLAAEPRVTVDAPPQLSIEKEVPESPAPDHLVRTVRVPGRTGRPPAWPSRLAAMALLVCALLAFPLHRDGASLRAYGFALGVSALCVVLALLVRVRPVVPVLALAVVVPAALAAGQLLEGRFRSARLSRVLDLAFAPPWLAGTAAVCASLAALTALVVRLASQSPGNDPTMRALVEAGHKAD
ncbi:hypothetical protein [Streptomyces fulvoviolaceus]|uniref:hypothetical protein n=1 Tax=Streptomyces fulvoviolaceus TaxID=285535 RepID=UPI0021BF1F39|nr:hypothetical protein [Streptomyces fulvoviolaceus]MCT9079821.1 hypothetical protein [Streptomyces fulvoviolaceus]